jgi:hypothetical protein
VPCWDLFVRNSACRACDPGGPCVLAAPLDLPFAAAHSHGMRNDAVPARLLNSLDCQRPETSYGGARRSTAWGAALSGEPAHQRPATRRSGRSDLERISSPCERCGGDESAARSRHLPALSHAAVDVIRKPSSLCKSAGTRRAEANATTSDERPGQGCEPLAGSATGPPSTARFRRIQVVSD